MNALNLVNWVKSGHLFSDHTWPNRPEIRREWGEPDSFGVGKCRWLLWVFGPMECHFAADGELLLLHLEDLAWARVLDDAWPFEHDDVLDTVLAKLSTLEVGHRIVRDRNTVSVVTTSGIEFSFGEGQTLHSVSQASTPNPANY